MDNPNKKSLIVRSRYGSGKTIFLLRLVKSRNPERVLFITYRQTLARDIMRNFWKLNLEN
ncbi:MAG: DEAD/DEAH box helicase family protein, partial [Candidatus Fonsibacter sp.]